MRLILSSSPGSIQGATLHTLAPLDAALLAWLALEGSTPRARLVQLIWPDKSVEAARNSLRQRLFKLRQTLGVELVIGNTTLALAPGVSHDLDDADTVLGDTAGEELATGEFTQWLELQRERRRERLRLALAKRSEQAEAEHDWGQALNLARELLVLNRLSEAAHRRLMRLHYLAGDRAAAMLAFDRCEQVLKDEVGAQPSGETLQLLEAIEQGTAIALRLPAVMPATVLRPPRMVGRTREFQAACVAIGQCRVAWISGEAGLGKSRLVQEVAAAVPGVIVCAARPGDDAVAFASLARLARSLIDQLANAGVAVEAPDLAAPPGAVTRAFAALLEAARRHGLGAVGLDDLHFADRASLETLASLLHTDPAPSMGWMLAQRSADVDPLLLRARDGLLDDKRLQPIALVPLDIAQVGELLASLALPEVDVGALAIQLHRRTGGNPLYLLETVRQAWSSGELQTTPALLPAPASVTQLIERRLQALSPSALKLSRCAAVAGVDFSLALASRVLHQDALDLADPWSELERAHVFNGGAFAHDLIHEAVLHSVPQPIAMHLHALIADNLAGSSGDPARIARHREAAAQWAVACASYREASLRACQQGRVLDAAALLADAARCADAQTDDKNSFDLLYERALLLAYFEYGPRTEQALAELEQRASDEAQVLAALAARMVNLEMRTDVEPILAQAADSTERARAIGRFDLEMRFVECWNLALCVQRRGAQALDLMQSYVDRFDEIDDPMQRFNLWTQYAMALDYAGRLREALPAWESAEATARAAGFQGVAWQAVSNRAMTTAKFGRVGEAAESGLAALREARARGDMTRERLASAESTVAHRVRDAGRYAEALSMLLNSLEFWAANDNPHELTWVEHRLAWLYQLLGQPERALRLLTADRPQVHIGLRTMRLVHRADVQRQLGGDGLALMREALTVITDEQDIYWRTAAMFATRCVPPAEGAELAASLAVWGAAQERNGFALAGHTRAAACLLAMGATSRAVPHAQAALRLAREFQPETSYLPETWLVAARVFSASGRTEEARRALDTGRAWVQDRAQRHVPPEFRASFIERNEVNRELLVLVARLPSDR